MSAVTVVGAGLAGSECAWQLARRGIDVRLVEMKPGKYTPAHVSPLFGELVCSNSLRGDDLTNAVGLLKEEMRRLGSLIMESAEANRVAAGGALAVDREGFARYITDKLRSHPHVEVVEAEAADFPEGDEVVIATGPLTSDALAGKIAALCGDRNVDVRAQERRQGGRADEAALCLMPRDGGLSARAHAVRNAVRVGGERR